MSGDIVETVILGAVLVLCVAYVVNKVRRKFSATGGCCGCAEPDACIRDKIGPLTETAEENPKS